MNMDKLPLACVLLLLMGTLNLYNVLATPESYWEQVFPKTAIPDFIRARLHPIPIGVVPMTADNRDPRFFYPDSSHKRDPRQTTFFLEEELKVGMNRVLYFPKSDFAYAAPFLAREIADAILFSSAELPQILKRFSLPTASVEANAVRETLAWCESLRGKAQCLTSLEAVIDYATRSTMDGSITTLHTHIDKDSGLQAYTVKRVEHKVASPDSTVCHNMAYPYALYYCHHVGEGKIYEVRLEGEDKSIVEAIAACHSNTRTWHPHSFAALPAGVKADHSFACHFLPDTHIVWA
ncbi:hypothetical protein AMTRI_Chr09g21210 [Amborella trichopoda]